MANNLNSPHLGLWALLVLVKSPRVTKGLIVFGPVMLPLLPGWNDFTTFWENLEAISFKLQIIDICA